jgi:hypothetical protein
MMKGAKARIAVGSMRSKGLNFSDMGEPRSNEDDDLLPELPRLEGGLEGEENFQPKDDSDLDLGDEQSELGLDGEAGLDEPLDGDLNAVEEEPASWLDDGKEPTALADDDGPEAAPDDESSQIEGSEPAADQAEDWDEDFGFDDRGGAATDGGEEGLGDEGLLDGLEIELPPLDDGAVNDDGPVEADPFAAEALGELAAGLDDDEADEELAPGVRGTRIARARVTIDLLLEAGRPLDRLIAVGAGAVACNGSALLVADPGAKQPEARFDEPGPVLALAGAFAATGTFLALSTPAGLLCSRDAGRSFARAPLASTSGMPELLSSLALTREGRGVRLWAAGAAGALWASDDDARSFRCVQESARVLRLHGNGGDALSGLARGEDGAALALRCARGDELEQTSLPVTEVERVQEVQAAGDVLLCCRRAPLPQLAVRLHGQWHDVPLAAPPALLLPEGDTVRLYCWAAREAGVLLVRVAVAAGARPEIVGELPRGAGAPLQLCGHHQAGVTTLHAGTERAWYRLVVRPEGPAR